MGIGFPIFRGKAVVERFDSTSLNLRYMSSCPHCEVTVEVDQSVCPTCGSTLTDSDPDLDPDQYHPKLLMEWVAEQTRITRLADTLPGDIYPPYLLVGLALVIDYGILQTYNYFVTGKVSWLSNPSNLTLALGLVVAVIGVRYMANQYAIAVASLELHDRPSSPDTALFETPISFRTQLAVYTLGVGIYYLNMFVGPGVQRLIEVEGLVKFVVGQFILAPLVNLVLVAEFALLFFGIQFLLPRRIAQADLDLFFYDPENMGGFKKVGQLLKRSYYVYTAGVLVYFLVAYGDAIFSAFLNSPYPEAGLQVAVFFTIAWAIGVASILYAMWRMHQLMVAKKTERIRELQTDLKEIIQNPYDIRSSQITDTEAMEINERQLNQVRATRTYPTTFTMWSQIAISVLLPQVMQLAVQATL